ncbi:hypothetical protein AX15_004514 [Amanita polypyramis BW_CC]|nr:hypothetical protein AX15_004514 [Amanita polypyramis BW_CC]
MRYGCRHLFDASSKSLTSSSSESHIPKDNSRAGRQGGRYRPRDIEAKRNAVKDAARKHHRKATLSKLNGTDYSFVYIGNIDPSINAQRLEEYFSKCGKVCRVQLRCSRGQAINIGIAVPENVRTSRDRQYATVEFKDYRGARKALQLNGKELDGCRLVVSITPTDLPEVQDIVDMRISEIRRRSRRNNEQDEPRCAGTR